ncbi:MAG: helix-turn-helix transcriptional regulator [Bacteroidota bacterium]
MKKNIHHGKNVKRFREMQGIKQEAFAFVLGDGWSQRKISLLEQKEIIDPELLEQLAAALKISVDSLRLFDDSASISMINQALEPTQSNTGALSDPTGAYLILMDKWIRALEENKKLYERLLLSEKEKSALLERLHSKIKPGNILEEPAVVYGRLAMVN